MYGEAMDSADKATNKAMSAAYKYLCMQVFCIPTEGMEDADSQTHEVAAKKPAEAKSKYTPAQQKVVDQKLAEARLAEAKPWLPKLRAMYDKLGESEYLRVLGNHGYTSAREITTASSGDNVLIEMAQAYEDQIRSRGVA